MDSVSGESEGHYRNQSIAARQTLKSATVKPALCRPSTSEIWLNCSGSLFMWSKVPEPPPSEWMIDGSKTHGVGEVVVNKQLNIIGSDLTTEPEREDAFQAYIKEMESKCPNLEEAERLARAVVYARVVQEQLIGFDDYPKGFTAKVESRLTLNRDMNLFGTADFAAVGRVNGKWVGRIVDLKDGAGVRVVASKSTQLPYYGAALMEMSKYPLEEVKVIIVQPKLEEWFTEITYTREELEAWKKKIEEGAQRAGEEFFKGEEGITLNAGEHCKWCRAKPVCRAHKDYLVQIAGRDFMELTVKREAYLLTVEDLVKILDASKGIRNFLDAVEERALSMILEGEEVPGYKVVEGRSVRKWRGDCDAKEWEGAIKAFGVEPLISEPKSVAVIEKEVGKKNFRELERFVIKPEGKPTLAKVDDKRGEIHGGEEFTVEG